MTLTPKNSGWIEVICGSMFSGKTEELIRRIRRAEIAKMNTIIFKPNIDNRYSSNHIVSHNQSKMESILVEDINEILENSTEMDVIGIDEAQFFSNELIPVCKKLAKDNKRVVVAGLDTDFKGIPFGPMPALMCESDFLDKLRAICVKCGNPASFSQRITKDSKQVLIGETDVYEARCRNCFKIVED
ncbi:MAG: thymidine kinase [Candidatus Marinimicrobia bacterium]|jgi:thymidine kinase|nr:thymidine kinase [Candidatus Neomarinimicrobiota bacterium]MBT7524060.1 thymidine kinase [Candidatus Neomarinimicrobiota bacterium]MDG2366270.1 thymidine kinase [Candidatus Neomarinimicrobiota bacterium]|tara:strand:+ start:4624 stop:5184 length:561 start_codon:yes stop_codon:yes gene_type:complete